MQTLVSVIITMYVLLPRKSPSLGLEPAERPSLGPTGPVWHLIVTDSITSAKWQPGLLMSLGLFKDPKTQRGASLER